MTEQFKASLERLHGPNSDTSLLNSIYTQAPGWVAQLPCVDLLRRVWLQHFYFEEGVLHWGRSSNLPPAALQICSPYDTEARFSHKRITRWLGYKVHLTETCDSDAPLVITHVETTSATLQDVSVVDKLHHDLSKLELLPKEHFVDMAYVSSDVLVTSARLGTELVGPARGIPVGKLAMSNHFRAPSFRSIGKANVQPAQLARAAIVGLNGWTGATNRLYTLYSVSPTAKRVPYGNDAPKGHICY